MSGIFAYAGTSPCAPLIIDALRVLEYQGYDSAGVAVSTAYGLAVCTRTGPVGALARAIAERTPEGTTGIGHTRRATHGQPVEHHAPSLPGSAGRVAVVHSGFIDNADELRALVPPHGRGRRAETHSDLLAHLVEYELACAPEHALSSAVRAALRHVRGRFAVAVLCRDFPRSIVAARQGSPLLLGRGGGGCVVGSDAAALAAHTSHAMDLNDGDVAVLSAGGARVFDAAGAFVQREAHAINGTRNSAPASYPALHNLASHKQAHHMSAS